MEELCNVPLHGANICRCDWLNNESDWPITGQDKDWWEGKTEKAGRKKGGVRRVTNRHREKQDRHVLLKKDTKPHGTA